MRYGTGITESSVAGAHEHKSDVSSGLVGKDKPTVTTKVKREARSSGSRYFSKTEETSSKAYNVNESNGSVHYRNNSPVAENWRHDNIDKNSRQKSVQKNTYSHSENYYQQGFYETNHNRVFNRVNNIHSARGNVYHSSQNVSVPQEIQAFGDSGKGKSRFFYSNSSSKAVKETGIKGVNYTDISVLNNVSVKQAVTTGVKASDVKFDQYLKPQTAVNKESKNNLVNAINPKRFNRNKAAVSKSAVVSGTAAVAFLANAENLKDDTGGETAVAFSRATQKGVNYLEKWTNKKDRSRYFHVANKTSDSVSVSDSGRFLKAVSRAPKRISGKAVRKVGAIGSEAISRALRSSDDLGAQSIVKTVDVAKYGIKSGKIAVKGTKATVRTTSKAVRYSVRTTQKAFKSSEKLVKGSQKVARATIKTSKAARKAAQEAYEATKAAMARLVSFLVNNPIGWIIIGFGVVLLIIFAICGTSISATKISSHSGTGSDSDENSLNQVYEVYDYVNESIATRCRDLFNRHEKDTGFLCYDYLFEIEDENGKITSTDQYPVADCTPIMSYLGSKYEHYSLTQNIKTEINNLVANLYTFTSKREPYSYTVDHGSGGKTTYTGEKITYTIRYHNAEKYIKSHNLIDSDRMSLFIAQMKYGNQASFKFGNILKDKDWHEWIGSQFGYTLIGRPQGEHDITKFSLKKTDYLELKYKNSKGIAANKIYSPINGKVTSIEEDDTYFVILTIKDSNNNFEFQVRSEWNGALKPTVSVGSTVKMGQQIATNSNSIHIVCTDGTTKVNPITIMENTPHAGN